ncbi:MAG: hypothetical protein ACTHOD_07835 [Motilibacteraceae bacterium]
MPTRLLLEGPDIAVLLDRVRTEHGAGARIVSAEKVRSGGFAGFFARERFEVTVEVDAPSSSSDDASEIAAAAAPTRQATAAAVESPASPTSLLDLAAAIDAAEAAFAMPAATAATLTPPTPPAPAEGPISTERPDFAAVLAGIARTAGSPSAPTDLPAALPELLAPAVLPEPEPVVRPLSHARPFVPAPIAPSELGNVVRPARREEPAASFSDETSEDVTAASAMDSAPAVIVQSDTASETASTVVAEPASSVAPEELFGGLLRRLTSLGLPRELAADVELDGADGLVGGLTRAIEAVLPTAPAAPTGAGEVLAVVGDGPVALEVAREVAKSLRLDPATVLLAGPSTYGSVHSARRVTGPADARRRAPRLQRADVPTVVAVDAPLEDGSADWARDVVGGIGATAVWAVVDATRKSADVAAHLELLGRVDALVVRATAATGDPASPLALAIERGLPTALVDRRRGDAACWAALVVDRLAAAGRRARTA